MRRRTWPAAVVALLAALPLASQLRPRRWPRRWAGGRDSALELVLWCVGLALLATAAWTLADARLFQVRAQRVLQGAVAREVSSWPDPIAEGTPIARLLIPSVDLDVAVAEGDSATVLRRAVGHLPASALPGERGNVVLAGHRDTLLRSLESISRGDVVTLESAAGTFRYRIEWTRVVEPSAVELIRDAGYPALTLVTCFPFRFIGPAPQRFVVRAKQLDAGEAGASGAPHGDGGDVASAGPVAVRRPTP